VGAMTQDGEGRLQVRFSILAAMSGSVSAFYGVDICVTTTAE